MLLTSPEKEGKGVIALLVLLIAVVVVVARSN
jgi:hypothetical protein